MSAAWASWVILVKSGCKLSIVGCHLWVDSTHSSIAAVKVSLWAKSCRWIRAFLTVPVRSSCNHHRQCILWEFLCRVAFLYEFTLRYGLLVLISYPHINSAASISRLLILLFVATLLIICDARRTISAFFLCFDFPAKRSGNFNEFEEGFRRFFPLTLSFFLSPPQLKRSASDLSPLGCPVRLRVFLHDIKLLALQTEQVVCNPVNCVDEPYCSGHATRR